MVVSGGSVEFIKERIEKEEWVRVHPGQEVDGRRGRRKNGGKGVERGRK